MHVPENIGVTEGRRQRPEGGENDNLLPVRVHQPPFQLTSSIRFPKLRTFAMTYMPSQNTSLTAQRDGTSLRKECRWPRFDGNC